MPLVPASLQPDCEEWARNGECEKSPRYMFWGCRLSCGRCYPPDLEVRMLCEMHSCVHPAVRMDQDSNSSNRV